MRQAHHVHAHIGHPLPFAAQIFIAHRVPSVFVLRVLVHAAKLDLAPVQIKAVVFDRDRAKSHPLGYCIARLSTSADFGAHGIKIRPPDVPEFGIVDLSHCLNSYGFTGRNGLLCHEFLARLIIRIGDKMTDHHFGRRGSEFRTTVRTSGRRCPR